MNAPHVLARYVVLQSSVERIGLGHSLREDVIETDEASLRGSPARSRTRTVVLPPGGIARR